MPLACAAEAAALQGRFWELHDALFEDPAHTDDPHLWTSAARLGLDVDRFEHDRRSEQLREHVRAQTRAGMRAGITVTPTLIAGGTILPGPPDAEWITRLTGYDGKTSQEQEQKAPPTETGGQERQNMSSEAVTRLSVEIAGSEISFETGRIAKQAGGAVVVRQGDTMVLATATAGNLRDADFLPLTVDVEERMYAAGKIPGSFFKREGRSGEKGTLTARMIDRPIGPHSPRAGATRPRSLRSRSRSTTFTPTTSSR